MRDLITKITLKKITMCSFTVSRGDAAKLSVIKFVELEDRRH